MSQQDLISDALKAGANGYIMKPFKPNRVDEIIRKYGMPRGDAESKLTEQAVAVEPEALAVELQLQAVDAVIPVEYVLATAEESETLPSAEAVEEPIVAERLTDSMESSEASAVSEIAAALEEPLPEAAEEAETELQLQPAWQLPADEVLLESEEYLELEQLLQDEGHADKLLSDEESMEQEEILTELPDLDQNDQTIEQSDLEEQTIAFEIEPQTVIDQVEDQEATETQKKIGKSGDSGKIINLFRGNGPMKNFTSSYMCNWNEEVNGDPSQFLVVCTESENKMAIEVVTNGNQKQTIHLSIEGFQQLNAWLQDKLGNAPVNVRELSKRADY
jgi:hypothetical protein